MSQILDEENHHLNVWNSALTLRGTDYHTSYYCLYFNLSKITIHAPLVFLHMLQMRHSLPFGIIFSRLEDGDGLFLWNKGKMYLQSWEIDTVSPSSAHRLL